MRPRLAAAGLALLAAACSGPPASTPIYVGPASAAFWTTLGAARRLFPGRTVPVTVVPVEGKVLEATDAEGRTWQQVGAKGEPLQLSSCRAETSPSGEPVSFCRGLAPGAPAFGRAADGGVLRRLEGGQGGGVAKVGEARLEPLPTGQAVRFTRAAGSSDAWLAAVGDQVLARGAAGKLTLAGEGRYLWATSADGVRRCLFMSRGRKASDRWVGERDGVIFVER